MMMRKAPTMPVWSAVSGLVALAACAPAVTPPPATTSARPVLPNLGVERVLGQNAASLMRLFGQPDADVREGTARKLQFQGPMCVLDAYLYPKGNTEPRVTYFDTRERDGSMIDRASCIAALSRRVAAQ